MYASLDQFISTAAVQTSPSSSSPVPIVTFATFSSSPSLSSSPLRQSTGTFRKVSLFSEKSSDSGGDEPPAGLLKQQLSLRQQQMDEEKAVGEHREGRSSEKRKRDGEVELQDQKQVADYKLTSLSSSAFSSSSCSSSPEAETAHGATTAKNYQTFTSRSASPPSSSSSSSSSSFSVTYARVKNALKPRGMSVLRDPVRTSSRPASVPGGSSTSSSSSSSTKKNEKEKEKERSFVAFVNTKSGAQKGDDALELLAEELGEDRVFDLVELDDLERCLEQFRGEENLCIVVGGGDGTYSSIINALIRMKFQPMPVLATLPMGTGNDLAREYGWGGGFEPTEESISETFSHYRKAEAVPMDIWRVEIMPQSGVTGESLRSKRTVQYMFNYFNIGFDARVSLGFDTSRKKLPWLFKAQCLNKLFYLFSVPGPAVKGMTELANCVMAEVDDDPITLPKDLRTMVVLNFTCYQAGLDIWGSAKEAENAAGYPVLWSTPSMSDRTVEVVGIGGLDHEAAVRTNMSKGYRLGQGSNVKLRILDDVALNIDGEPQWQKAPCEVSVTRWGCISVLKHPPDEEAGEKDKDKGKQKEKEKKHQTKVRLGKRIAKRRTTATTKSAWEQSSKFSLGGFLLYMLTGSV